MLSITAVIRVRPGQAEAMRRALDEVVAAVRAGEPGTIGYFVAQDQSDPCLFTTYERYRDEAAMASHNASPAVAHFFALAKPMLEGEVLLVTGSEVAAKA